MVAMTGRKEMRWGVDGEHCRQRYVCEKVSQARLLFPRFRMASLVKETSGLAISAQKKQQTTSITTTKLKGHRGPVLCLAATQKYLLSGSADSSVRLWDRKSNKCLKAMLLKDEVNSVAFHSRKDHLIYATCNNSIYMFDVKSNSSSMILKIPIKYNEHATADEINDMIIDSKGRYLICVDDNGDISIFDAMTLEVPKNRERVVGNHENIVSAVKLFPRDAFVFATGGMDSILSIWSGSTMKKVKAIDVKIAPSVEDEGGNDGKVRSSVSSSTQMLNPPFINDVGYSRNGKNIAVACGDSSIIVYSSKDGVYKKRYSGGHSSGVAQVVYTKSGRLVSAGNDRMICCWGDSEGELKFEHPVPINKLLIRDSKDKRVGALLYVADNSNSIAVYGGTCFA